MADADSPKRSDHLLFLKVLVRSFSPVLIVAAYGILVLPSSSNLAGPPVSELAWYQQIASFAFLPAMLWSWHRFNKAWKKEKPTIEEQHGVSSR